MIKSFLDDVRMRRPDYREHIIASSSLSDDPEISSKAATPSTLCYKKSRRPASLAPGSPPPVFAWKLFEVILLTRFRRLLSPHRSALGRPGLDEKPRLRFHSGRSQFFPLAVPPPLSRCAARLRSTVRPDNRPRVPVVPPNPEGTSAKRSSRAVARAETAQSRCSTPRHAGKVLVSAIHRALQGGNYPAYPTGKPQPSRCRLDSDLARANVPSQFPLRRQHLV